jgi:ADP-ribose pyrophosphatase YjhB (NUDIX family)
MIQTAFRLTRSLTLGVRGVVVDAEGRVLLVEHSYQAGWRLPGGGVERGETAEEALARELADEAGVQIAGPPRLVSIHSQHRRFKGDHVLVYAVADWTPCPPKPGLEIRAARWFDPAALPERVARADRARLAEAFEGRAADPLW